MKVSISSPAKINLHLKILDKNSDGYHNLDTSFQFIDLYDFMTFEQAKDGILIDINNSSLNAKENTIYKAAVSLQELSKKNYGAKITIQKNIIFVVMAAKKSSSKNQKNGQKNLNDWKLTAHSTKFRVYTNLIITIWTSTI